MISASMSGDPTTVLTVTGAAASHKQSDVDGGLSVFFEEEGISFIGCHGTYRNRVSAYASDAGIHLEIECRRRRFDFV